MEERNNNEETVKIPVSEYKKFLKAQTRLEFLMIIHREATTAYQEKISQQS
ncbi:hypothetical protein [Coprococcus comes]|uniref:hypothetical protein n=1 Tax=Coprococcus comes TaxID=410072 RepID=UPI001B3C7B0C|nr:hypothetical protein [Coprococcus comes]